MAESVNFPPVSEISIFSTMVETPQIFDQQLGTAIRSARRAKGWSQERLAARVSILRATLGYYERGARPIPARTLNRIAIALDIKPGHFFREAEATGSDANGDAAARKQRIEEINRKMGPDTALVTLDMILHILDLSSRSK